MSAAAEQITYEDLYSRWEKGNWSATEIDFSQDKLDWQDKFTDFERKAAIWNYSLFFWGEDAVTDDLSPLVDAAPREEQKYFLATQQVDEARHAVFFKRFFHEVAGIGDGSMAGGLNAILPELTWGYRKVFGLLERVTGELRKDRSATALARAVTMYHMIVEASLAQAGQHFIEDYLTERDVLPGFRKGMRNVALDEQRHIAFGVRLLYDLKNQDPDVPEAIADLLREALPYTTALFVPPGWDRRYSEVFGFTIEDIFEYGIKNFESRFRAAGMPLDELPGPIPIPMDLPPRERAERGIAMLQAGFLGEKNGPPARDRESIELLFDSVRRGVDHRAAKEPVTIAWDFLDAPCWHIRIDNGHTAAGEGTPGDVGLVLRCRYDDWVDVIAGRADARKLMLTGRLRPRGSLRVLARMPRLFPG
jgi:Ribonucleotide reductase, small chain/SCP-2 sterol transfer family